MQNGSIEGTPVQLTEVEQLKATLMNTRRALAQTQIQASQLILERLAREDQALGDEINQRLRDENESKRLADEAAKRKDSAESGAPVNAMTKAGVEALGSAADAS
jgi:hypothetical protein